MNEIDACRSFGISNVLQSFACDFQNVANTLQVVTVSGIQKNNHLRPPELNVYLYNFLSARIDFIYIYTYNIYIYMIYIYLYIYTHMIYIYM